MSHLTMVEEASDASWRILPYPYAGPTRGVSGDLRYSDVSIPRRRLLRRLLRSRLARLIVVQGPAGFGKTTLLRQYCNARVNEGAKVSWIHMETHSADPARLVQMLCEAAEDAAELPQDRRGGSSVQDFVTVAATLPQHSTFVIDNLEHSTHPGLEIIFTQLVRLLPEGIQLCLAARTIPPINLPRMQLREQAVVLSVEELRFGLGETTEFLREFKTLQVSDVEELHRATDGWPAALQCVRLCLRNGRLRQGAALSSGGMTPELIEFLTSGVYEGLSEDVQAELLTACLPERICPELLAYMESNGSADGAMGLAAMERAGLFLSRMDATSSWYTFHNVFRQFLLSRLRLERSPSEIIELHRRAAEWLAANGYLEEAILGYLEADQPDIAATLLSRIIDRLVAEERLAMICRCVNKLPNNVLQRHEGLLNAAVIAYSFRREFRKAEQLLEQRHRFLEQTSAAPDAWGGYSYTKMFLLCARDRVEDMDAVARRTLDLVSPDDGFRYAVALNAHAFHLTSISEFDKARGLLLQARPLHDDAGNLFGQAYQESISATILSARGRLKEAVQNLQEALGRVERGGSAVAAGAVLAAYLAEGLYEQNLVDVSEQLLNDYGPTIEQQTIVDPLAVAMTTVARIQVLRGEPEAAEAVLERVISLGHRHDLPRAGLYARLELCRMATLSGQLTRAGKLLSLLGDGGNEGEADGEALFQASETEACTVTRARFLIASGEHAEARGLLQGQIRRARLLNRNRRLLKLLLLQGISLNATGETSAARRALIAALEIGGRGGFVRSFLDEGAPAIRLIKETRMALPRMPDLPHRDVVATHMDHLLAEAGEAIPTVPEDAGLLDEDVSLQLFDRLTERERNILKLVAGGFSNRDLAERLSVSENTIKWHLRNIFEKLQIRNRMQAVVVARHFGLID